MLRNYIKLLFKVLRRNKFFTFVSLFGITITLMILIALVAVFDSAFGPYGSEKKMRRTLYIHAAVFSHDKQQNTSMGSTSWYFLNKTIGSLKTAENASVVSSPSPTVCYTQEGRKLNLMRKYCDAAFWEILEFDFISGGPITQQDVDLANRVIVIDKSTAIDYFGTTVCLGKTITLDGLEYRVKGITNDNSILRIYPFANIYQPVTTYSGDLHTPSLNGIFMGMVLARDRNDFTAIRAEFQRSLDNFTFPDPERYNQVRAYLDTYLAGFMRFITGAGEKTNMAMVSFITLGVILLFMSFPTLNLVNINISRIIERASEIGIRRSFGASAKTLLYQFIIENVMLTLLGGIIGLVLGLIIIFIINTSGAIPNFTVHVSFPFFFYALIIILFFGVFSGVYPAWRMSKLQIVNALKSTNL